jgi:hypothetical protein
MKKVNILVNPKNNRVEGVGSTPFGNYNVEIEIEDNHKVEDNPFVFRFENGVLIHDDEYEAMMIEQEKKNKNKPSLKEKLESIEMVQAEMVMDSVMKDLTIQEQAEQLKAADELTATLLFDLSMKGVI